MGWRVRHGLAGDIPFFIAVVACAGAIVGAVIGFVFDELAHRHRGTLR